jgi:hypothetical protein
MNTLSFEFKYYWMKFFLIIIIIVVNLFLITILGLSILNNNFTFLAILFTILYILESSIYGFLLYKSVSVKYDDTSIIILKKQIVQHQIDFSSIIKIKRTYYWFYRIEYNDEFDQHRTHYFYISPNPPFTQPDRIKKLKEKIFIKIKNSP